MRYFKTYNEDGEFESVIQSSDPSLVIGENWVEITEEDYKNLNQSIFK